MAVSYFNLSQTGDRQLVENCKKAYEMFNSYKMSINEIANMMGIRPRTVQRYKLSYEVYLGVKEDKLYSNTTHIVEKQIDGDKEIILKGGQNHYKVIKKSLPPKGKIKTYILTSLQNNTIVNKNLWKNIQAFAQHTDAEIIISKTLYRKNNLNTSNEKNKTEKGSGLGFDKLASPHLTSDRIILSDEVVFYGDSNISPTKRDPLNGLPKLVRTPHNAIVPSNELGYQAIPQHSVDNRNFHCGVFTTATIGLPNFIDSFSGKLAEMRNMYGFVFVTVDSDGKSFVYDVESLENGTFQVLNLRVEDGQVFRSGCLSLTFGDAHTKFIEDKTYERVWTGKNSLVKVTRPKNQIVHDIFDCYFRNHHHVGNTMLENIKFHTKEGYMDAELQKMVEFLDIARTDYSTIHIIESNHDNALVKYIQRQDLKTDFENDEILLDSYQHLRVMIKMAKNIDMPLPYGLNRVRKQMYKDVREYLDYKKDSGGKPLFIEYIMRHWYGINDRDENIKFHDIDTKLVIGGTYHPYHGDRGVNGLRGAGSLHNIPEPISLGHGHTLIRRGRFMQAGVLPDPDFPTYASGPNSRATGHIIGFDGGMRGLLIERDGKYGHEQIFHA